jgi:hypothetical protein
LLILAASGQPPRFAGISQWSVQPQQMGKAMDFVTAIASVTKGLEILKAMQDIDKNLDAASYKGKIADLTVALADAKRDLVDARDEVAAGQEKIARLKEAFRMRAEGTVVVRGRRYERHPDGTPMGMPYCQRCETMDGVLIHLAEVSGKEGYKAVCPQCKSDFGIEHGYMYPEDGP